MDIELTTDDVLIMAEQIEEDASSFYTEAASMCTSQGCARTMLRLASMEDDHVAIFSVMRTHLCADGWSSAPIDSHRATGEDLGLLRYLVSGIRQDLGGRFGRTDSPDDVLRKAIEFEKDTIVLFVSMKGMLPRTDDQKKMDHVIREEVGHVLMLAGERVALNRPGQA